MQDASQEQHGVFSPAVRNYALGVLVVVYTFNFIDRQILSILLEPIKQDLGLSDSALGMLTGFAFALFYATLGIPIARFADRSNRRNLIAWALAIWSAMTAVSGLAQNFWHLLSGSDWRWCWRGRLLASCPLDARGLFPNRKPSHCPWHLLAGYSLRYLVWIYRRWLVERILWLARCLFHRRRPWLITRDPRSLHTARAPRGMAEGRVADEKQPTIMETFRFLWSKRSFRHMAVGGGLTAFVGYGVITWVPSFLIRSYGMSTGDVGTYLGLILGIPGGIGIALGGYLADRYGARDTRWYLWIVSVALIASTPLFFGVYLSNTAFASLMFLILPILLGNFYQATTFSQTQGLVSLRMRSVAAAVLLFILNMIGLGAGPQAVGILSDILQPSYGDESLRYALLILSTVQIWAAYHYYQAGKSLKEDLVTD